MPNRREVRHNLPIVLIGGLIAVLIISPLVSLVFGSHGSTPHLMLFWDGTDASVPSGWSLVTAANGRFLRGESAANYGLTGGNASHTPTTSSLTHSGPSSERGSSLLTARAATGHTHSTSATIGTANNLPAYRSLKLIRYDAGVPNVIPAGAIGLFDDSPGIPAGWTRQTTQDSRMIQANSSVATGGSDTHTHTATWTALGASSGTAGTSGLSNNRASANGHTHSAPAASATSSITALPPYIQVLVAKADSNIATLPGGLIGMFDGDPGQGWNIRSDTGGTFNQQFMRGAATYNGTSQGSPTHNHASVTSGNTGTSGQATGSGTGTGVAAENHTHTLTANFDTGSDNMPQYFNVVVAEKVGFTLSNYRWYADSPSEDVTDAWGTPDIAQNTAITPIPAPNDAPGLTKQLRLRLNMTISGGALAAGTMQFKLQYKPGTDASCTTGSWTDVDVGGGAGIWRFASSAVIDGTTLSTSRLSPTSSILESYAKSNPSVVNSNGATIGQTVEYGWHIEHNGAVDASQYSFRVVESSDLLLAGYSVCPTLTTAPGTDNLTRGGQFWSDQVRSSGYFWAD
jgi:hypothetical protein